MNRITVKIGTYGYNLEFTLLNYDNSPYNIEGSVYFKMWKPGEWINPILVKECTVVDAAAGICTLPVSAGDLKEIGNFLYEIEEVISGVRKDAFITGEIVVRESP